MILPVISHVKFEICQFKDFPYAAGPKGSGKGPQVGFEADFLVADVQFFPNAVPVGFLDAFCFQNNRQS